MKIPGHLNVRLKPLAKKGQKVHVSFRKRLASPTELCGGPYGVVSPLSTRWLPAGHETQHAHFEMMDSMRQERGEKKRFILKRFIEDKRLVSVCSKNGI